MENIFVPSSRNSSSKEAVTMKHLHIFSNNDYYLTLKHQIDGELPVYHGYRQRGGGVGSLFRLFSQYVVPLIQKYILPHATNALVSSAAEVVGGAPIKSVVKKNSQVLLNNIADGVLKRVQKGTGVKKVHH